MKIPVLRPGFINIINSVYNGTFLEKYLFYSPQCMEEIFRTLTYVK